MSIQNNYPERLDAGRPGQIVNMELCNLISRDVEAEDGITFGKAVQRGTAERGAVSFAGGTFLGITVRERSSEPTMPNGFRQFDSARIITKGAVYVESAAAVTAGQGVFIDDATGDFFGADDTGRTAVANAVWDTTNTAAGLAVVALDIR